MEYTPQIFLNLINSQQTLPQVISIIGEEMYFRMQILTALTENVFADVELQDREIHHFEKDLDLNALEQTINSYPFFGGHTLVIIQDEKFFEVNKNGISDAMAKRLEKVTEILDNVPEYCTVILALSKLDKRIKFYKKIKELGAICICDGVKPENLAPWLKEQAAAHGGSFDYSGIGQIMEYLMQVETAPLNLLVKEIEKLAITCGTNSPWTNIQVEQVFSDLPELGTFKLVDAMGKKDLRLTLKYLQMESKKTRPEPEKIIGGLRAKLKLMIRVLEYQNAGISFNKMTEAFADLKSASFQIRNVMTNLKKGFTMSKLLWAYKMLGEANSLKRQEGFSNDDVFKRIQDILIVFLN